ncbi:hypothetical protein ABZ942_15135 [Nocardia sp. NPDC046473]|uniref:hypothetical protein n=1 Tax=Nocardia sp. NPDC046473 TaxID=3155733 RepID=UPI0033CC2D08
MLRRASTLASASALATVACAGVAAAAPTTTPATPPTVNNVDITAAAVSGSGVDVSVTYTCEATGKDVMLQVFVRSTGEGAEQTVGAKTKAKCNAESQTVSVTAAKIADFEPFTPAAGDMVRVVGSLVLGDTQQGIQNGTAIKRLTVK